MGGDMSFERKFEEVRGNGDEEWWGMTYVKADWCMLELEVSVWMRVSEWREFQEWLLEEQSNDSRAQCTYGFRAQYQYQYGFRAQYPYQGGFRAQYPYQGGFRAQCTYGFHA